MDIKMGESLLQIIKRVGIFMVCAQMLLHFKPSESYGKYIRLLMSMMVLAQLVSPVMAILGRGNDISFGEQIMKYEEIFRLGMEEADTAGAEAQALLERMTLEEVKSRINSQKETEETSEEGAINPETENEVKVSTGVFGAQATEEERLVERIEVKLYD